MPTTPRSQPGMTWPCPSGNENGWPLSQEASNSDPVDHDEPTYCTLTVSPGLAALPLPATMSFIVSLDGVPPAGMATTGLTFVSLEMLSARAATASSAEGVGPPDGALAGFSELELSSPPQAASGR